MSFVFPSTVMLFLCNRKEHKEETKHGTRQKLGRNWQEYHKEVVSFVCSAANLYSENIVQKCIVAFTVYVVHCVCVSVLGDSFKVFGPLSVPLQKAASTRGASITIMMAASVAVTLPSTNRAKVRSDVLTPTREAFLKFLI